MDFLEEEYGIKEGQSYSITYINDNRDLYYIKRGLVLNFNPSQIVVKSDKGLHIFKTMYITEMKPLYKSESMTIQEAYKQPIGTKFRLYCDDGSKSALNAILDKRRELYWEDDNIRVILSNEIANAKFKIIE